MKTFWLALLAGIILLVFFWRTERGDEPGMHEDSTASDEMGFTEKKPEVRFITGSFLVSDYGKEGGSEVADLEALRDVLGHCQTLIKDFDRFHLPGNSEIVRFLQGENPGKLAWIPADFSFLSDQGELVDRFGTPVFFHRLSGTQFEFRSAGPDRRMWTDDDVTVK